MKTLRHLILVVIALFTGCGTVLESRIEITPPPAELTFDEAFVKDRDIHLQMPEDIVLGWIAPIVDPEGNLIFADYTQDTVFLTDAEGNYLRQIGARGGGEGEYLSIFKLLLAPNGDLYIYSMGEDIKYMVFFGVSYTFKREFRSDFSKVVDRFVVTEGGNMYASKVDSEHSLLRFDDNFETIGRMYPVKDQRTATALHRYNISILTSKRGGGFYFMYPTSYEIYQYSEQGELEQTLFSDYRSKHRDGIKPFPANLEPPAWNPKIEAWFAKHIVRSQLFECDPDLLVLEQYRREVGGKVTFYLNILGKDGHSVADGIRVPDNLYLTTIDGSELYFSVESAFSEATGETSDPYVAVYRLNDRAGVGKVAFSRSQGG